MKDSSAFEIEASISNPQCDELVGYVEFDVSGSHDGEYQYMVYNQVTNPVINDYNENDTINLISGEHTFIFIDSQGWN